MANLKEKLESGADVEIQVASFEKSHALLQATKAAMIPVENVIDLILSPAVQPALWDCMDVCLYKGKRINRDTFENENDRGDYLLVAKKVLMANLLPFYKSLVSPLKENAGDGSTGSQKSS
jgi:hypothetical protein